MNRRRLPGLLFVTALLGGGLLAGPAEAHVSRFLPAVDVVPEPTTAAAPTLVPADPAWTAAPIPAGVPWVLVAALAGITALGAHRPRRTLTVALVLILAVFAFENGVHSVHHLNDQDRGERCALASASQHVAGATCDGVLATDVPAPAEAATVAAIRVFRSTRSFGPPEGRAPPARPA